MFKKNDIVSYGTSGVCTITGITEKKFADFKMEYYVLQPVHQDTSTIYVPVHNEKLTAKMRKILSAEEVHDLIRSMPDEDDIWISDNVERKNVYRSIINSGNPKDIIKVIKTLQRVQMEKEASGKRLSTSDEYLLNDAQRILHDEFALVLNIQPEQVDPFILKELDDMEED